MCGDKRQVMPTLLSAAFIVMCDSASFFSWILILGGL